MNRYDPIFNVLQYALHPPAVIIVYQAFHSKVIHSQTSLPSLTPSTRFPAGTVLVLLTPVRFNCGLRRSRFSIPITRGRPLLEPPVLVKHFILRVRVADDTQHVLVETTGVEPVVPFGRRIYSPLGLPIFLHLHVLEELRGIEPRLPG